MSWMWRPIGNVHSCRYWQGNLSESSAFIAQSQVFRDSTGWSPTAATHMSPGSLPTWATCSDSRGAWHHGPPLRHEAVLQSRGLQLLTHPIWWHAAPGETVREKLDRFALQRFDLLRAELARNCESYPQEFLALDSQYQSAEDSQTATITTARPSSPRS